MPPRLPCVLHRPALLGLALMAMAASLVTAAAAAPTVHTASAAHTAAAAAVAHTEAGVHVTQAWIRWLPADLPAGGYLTLVNDSAHAVTLVAAHSAAYASVALHRTLTSGGTARMVPVAALSVPPHATLDFASLGYHLMLTHARHPVQPVAQVPLTLQFADGGTLTLTAEVKPPAAQPAKSGKPGMHGMPGMPDMPGMSH